MHRRGADVLREAGAEGLVAVGTGDGAVRVPFDVCQHRAARLLEDGAGTLGRCPAPDGRGSVVVEEAVG